ncbi:MAG: hypothetical protein MUD08_09545 [Cytophagales bacterium]|jgi:hypothetical protein|nr:hypothetical protein [Cytophagales bacterium]
MTLAEKIIWIDQNWNSFSDDERGKFTSELRAIAALEPSQVSVEDKRSINEYAYILMKFINANLDNMEEQLNQLGQGAKAA